MPPPAYELYDRDTERRHFLAGIECFNERRFHDAHDEWEEIWHNTAGRKAQFYRALNHAAVTLEHLARNNPNGVKRVWSMTLERFAGLPPTFMGLEIEPFVNQLRYAIAPVLAMISEPDGSPIALRQELPWNANDLPTITLVYDPFETGEADRA